VRATLEAALAEAAEKNIVRDAVIAASEAQRMAFWRTRTGLTEVQKPEGGSIKHDISVPVGKVPALIEQAGAAVEKLVPGARPVPFGHLGDGNIHYNISQPVGADRQAFLDRWEEVNAAVHGIVAKLGGSISAEHGIGVLKRELLPGVKDPVELELMRSLKRALDPDGILNPGKVL
jgi:FAD/FMN-containing dehydrogenase